VDNERKTPAIFSLRLAASLRELAKAMADRDGISLNQFINMAVAEKIARIQEDAKGGSRKMSLERRNLEVAKPVVKIH
jgi:hypothetical protein